MFHLDGICINSSHVPVYLGHAANDEHWSYSQQARSFYITLAFVRWNWIDDNFEFERNFHMTFVCHYIRLYEYIRISNASFLYALAYENGLCWYFGEKYISFQLKRFRQVNFVSHILLAIFAAYGIQKWIYGLNAFSSSKYRIENWIIEAKKL